MRFSVLSAQMMPWYRPTELEPPWSPPSTPAKFAVMAPLADKRGRFQLLLSNTEDHQTFTTRLVGVTSLLFAMGLLALAMTILKFARDSPSDIPSKILPGGGASVMGVPSDGLGFYCLAMPLIVPPSIIAIYFNWLALNFLRRRES